MSNFVLVPECEEMLLWAQKHRHLDVPGDMFLAYASAMWQYHFSPAGDLWFKTAEEWAERERVFCEMVDQWSTSGNVTGAVQGYAEVLVRSRSVTIHFLGLKHGFIPPTPVLDVTESWVSSMKQFAIRGDLQFYTENPLCHVVVPAILTYQVGGPLQMTLTAGSLFLLSLRARESQKHNRRTAEGL